MSKLNTRSMSTSNRTYPAIAVSSPRAGLSSPSRILKSLSTNAKHNFLFSLKNRFNRTQASMAMMGSSATILGVTYNCSTMTVACSSAFQYAIVSGNGINYHSPLLNPSSASQSFSISLSKGTYYVQTVDSFNNISSPQTISVNC